MSAPLQSLIERAIKAAAPKADAAGWAAALLPFMQSSGIITAKRIAAFVGQCAVESNGYGALEENLHYSPERLLVVFPSHFSGTEDAAKVASGGPEAVANRVYGGRMGNGPEASGDGWKFRGRGLIQLTGRANYQAYASSLAKAADAIADSLATKAGAAQSACWFWGRVGGNDCADKWMITVLGQRINGGSNGADARQTACASALRACG